MQNREYSSIRSHKELLQAINEISNKIEIQSSAVDAEIIAIKYKYSFRHFMGVAATKVGLMSQVIKGFLLSINNLRKKQSKQQNNPAPEQNEN